MEYAMIDATIVKVHRHGQGAKEGLRASQAIGRSKGGLTTKILALNDALGKLVRFVLLPGHQYDTIGVPPLIEGLRFGALIADRPSTGMRSSPISTNGEPRSSSPSINAEPENCRSTLKCTNGVTWLAGPSPEVGLAARSVGGQPSQKLGHKAECKCNRQQHAETREYLRRRRLKDLASIVAVETALWRIFISLRSCSVP
jgi:hypothetical protein